MKTLSYNKKIATRIITHLQQKQNNQDDFDGLILSIYEQEIKTLSFEILSCISALITSGIIAEIKDRNGRIFYRLH